MVDRQGGARWMRFRSSAPGAPSLLFVGHRQAIWRGMSRSLTKPAMPCMGSGCSAVAHPRSTQRQQVVDRGLRHLQRTEVPRSALSASHPRAKAYYLKSLLDDIILQLFVSSEEADLEQSIYQQVVADEVGERRRA